MEKLLVLLVTAEQETIIQTFYSQQKWLFLNIGPHLSELTVNEISKLTHAIPNPSLEKDNSELVDTNLTAELTETYNDQRLRKTEGNNPCDKKQSKIRTGLRSNKSQADLPQKDIKCKSGKPEKINETKDKRTSARKSCTLKENKAERHDELEEKVEAVKWILVETPVSERTSKFTCSQCSYTTNNSSNFQRHLREVHGKHRHQCTKCSKTFKSKHAAKSHLIYAHVKDLQCEKCGRKFTSHGGLLNHTKHIHQKKVLYKCEICESSFFYRQHYIGHMNRHSATKPHKCCQCDKTFVYKSSCKLHERSCLRVKEVDVDTTPATTNKPKVLCDICGEELSSKSVLKTHHKMVHTDEPKSKCTECGKSFKGEYSLKRHVKTAHTEAKNISLPCEVCGKSFNQIEVLRQHLKRHKKDFSVRCQTCGKGFYSNYKLKEHERIHTGEKPYTCPVCKTFKCASKYNLASHMKVHEDGRPIKVKRKKEEPTVTPCDTSRSESHSKQHNIGEGQIHDQGHFKVTEITTQKEDGSAVVSSSHTNILQSHHVQGHGGQDGVHDVGMNSPISVHYENNQYQPHNVISYEQRIQNDSFYGNTSSAVAQGLNILTVAMNLVDHTPY